MSAIDELKSYADFMAMPDGHVHSATSKAVVERFVRLVLRSLSTLSPVDGVPFPVITRDEIECLVQHASTKYNSTPCLSLSTAGGLALAEATRLIEGLDTRGDDA